MRIVFSALSLLIVVAIVAVLAKKQLGSVPAAAPGAPPAVEGVAVPNGTPKQQLDQFKHSVESAVQQTRPAGDDTK